MNAEEKSMTPTDYVSLGEAVKLLRQVEVNNIRTLEVHSDRPEETLGSTWFTVQLWRNISDWSMVIYHQSSWDFNREELMKAKTKLTGSYEVSTYRFNSRKAVDTLYELLQDKHEGGQL